MTQNDKVVMLIGLLFTLSSVAIPVFLYYRKLITSFAARKAIHSISGLIIFILLFLDAPIWAFLLSITVTLVVFASTQKSRIPILKYFFESINEAEEVALGYLQGPVSYCIAISTLCLVDVFFPSYKIIFIVAMLTMMYADTLAAIVGKKYGKTKLFGLKRSLEGSVAFFVISVIISLIVFTFFGNNLLNNGQNLLNSQILILSIVGSIGATVVELFSPSKWDDILIPFGMTGILIVLTNLLKYSF